MKVKLIARVSTEKQDADIRMKELREFARSNNYKIVAEYWINESATIEIDDRKDFLNALEEDKGEEIVIINKLDRLTRNFKSISWFEEYLSKARFKLIALDHEPNLNTATGRFVFRQLLLIACFETEQTKERMRAKVDERKKKGLYKGRKKGAVAKQKYSPEQQTKETIQLKCSSNLFITCILALKSRFKQVFRYLEVVLDYYTKN